jgi:2-polyprenyl-3-methyl-5-hydroxy-6-metoxy-1,4-benzoquinol methylase
MIEKPEEYKQANKQGRFRRGLLNPFIAASVPQAQTILDMGCGSGDYHSLMLAKNGTIRKIVGIDNSPEMLKSAVQSDKCDYFCMDVLDPSLPLPHQFDCVISIFLIEHFSTA